MKSGLWSRLRRSSRWWRMSIRPPYVSSSKRARLTRFPLLRAWWSSGTFSSRGQVAPGTKGTGRVASPGKIRRATGWADWLQPKHAERFCNGQKNRALRRDRVDYWRDRDRQEPTCSCDSSSESAQQQPPGVIFLCKLAGDFDRRGALWPREGRLYGCRGHAARAIGGRRPRLTFPG